MRDVGVDSGQIESRVNEVWTIDDRSKAGVGPAGKVSGSAVVHKFDFRVFSWILLTSSRLTDVPADREAD